MRTFLADFLRLATSVYLNMERGKRNASESQRKRDLQTSRSSVKISVVESPRARRMDPCVASRLERWLSGRKRRFAKSV